MKNIDNFESIKLKSPKFTNSKKIIKIFILCLFFIFNSGVVRSENSLENKLLAPEISDEQAHNIVLNGTPDEVKNLINSVYDVNKAYLCNTLLNTAIKSAAVGLYASKEPSYAIDKIKILVNAGADVNRITCPGESMSALHWAVSLPSQLQDIAHNANKVIDDNVKNKTGECNFPGIVLKPCANITPDEKKQIEIAINNSMKFAYNLFTPYFMEIIAYLVEHGADLDQKGGTTDALPIHLAAFNTPDMPPEPLNYLITKGANINAKDINGNTPLFWAYGGNNKKAIDILLKAGADKNVINNEGALYNKIAAQKQKVDVDEHRNITLETY